MLRGLPLRIHLPSGRIVHIDERAARAAASVSVPAPAPVSVPAPAPVPVSVPAPAPMPAPSEPPRSASLCLHHLAVLQSPGVLFEQPSDARAPLRPLDPLELPLRDAHVLRAFLAKHGVVHEDLATFTCENCGAPFQVAPSTLLETAPFLDGELQDPELDAPFDFKRAHRIPAIRVGASVARRVRLAPRTVDEALPLWRASQERTLTLTPALVAAIGVVELGAERRASVIADALADASPKAWSAIVDLFHLAHYPARLLAVFRCDTCGARSDLDVPLERELPRELTADHDRGVERPRAGFPELDRFEQIVRAAADSIYAERRVRNVDLFIDDGVPACDDGGEPLLGCYTPGAVDSSADLIPARPEIRIFYRSFLLEHRADPSFNVEREIHETIDHEIDHHLSHIAGHDPVDDEERGAIDVERARLVGRRETTRRAARGFAADLLAFLRLTWPLWLLLALAFALVNR